LQGKLQLQAKLKSGILNFLMEVRGYLYTIDKAKKYALYFGKVSCQLGSGILGNYKILRF